MRINGGYFVLRQEIFDYLREGDDLVMDGCVRAARRRAHAGRPVRRVLGADGHAQGAVVLEDLYRTGESPWAVWRADAAGSRTPAAPRPPSPPLEVPDLNGGSVTCSRSCVPDGPLRIVCLGAHPDDIEIGCGGTLLTLAAARPVQASVVVPTGTPERHAEARKATAAFLPGADVDVRLLDLPDGRLPAHWDTVKALLEDVAATTPAPDLVFAPRRDDAHQDHRLVAELAPTVWRDALVLRYEIPKWDGDLGPGDPLRPARRRSWPAARWSCSTTASRRSGTATGGTTGRSSG